MQYVSINLIELNKNNPRFIRDHKFKQLVQSIIDFPEMLEKRPIIVNKDMIVLGGNMRLRACKEAGLHKVPIEVVDWSEAKQREFIIKDNVAGGEWDWDLLSSEWDVQQLDDWGLDLPFSMQEDAVEDDYEIPETVVTDIEVGDIFQIGPHRLVCGDSTHADVVQQLLQGAQPYLMVTDPPYGVEYDASWRNELQIEKNYSGSAVGEVMNDHESDWTPVWAMSPASIAYVWHAAWFTDIVAKSLKDSGYEIRSNIIWNKNQAPISRGHYHWKHEPCWYAVKKNHTARWAGDRKQNTVWDIDKPSRSETGHSSQKPVECMAKAIANHDGDVYDPFIGSGTTMVAAHQLKRVCYGIELNPKYCQVIIERMKNLDPTLEVVRLKNPETNVKLNGQ